jgi:hypothetical protein
MKGFELKALFKLCGDSANDWLPCDAHKACFVLIAPSAPSRARARDKYRTRVALHEAGLAAPKAKLLTTLDDIPAVMAEVFLHSDPPRRGCEKRSVQGVLLCAKLIAWFAFQMLHG